MSPLERRTPLRPKKPFRKSVEELLKEGKVQRASSFTAKRKMIRKRAKANKGWVDIALAKWNEPGNDHCCEVCGKFLGEDFSPAFYHHLLHRGSYRSLKREPRNLAQLCAGHHDAAHKYGVENLAEHDTSFPEQWRMLAERMIELRNEANNVKKP